MPKRQLPLGGPGLALEIAKQSIEAKTSKTHVTENAPRDPKYNAGADCLAKTVIKAVGRGDKDQEVGGAVRVRARARVRVSYPNANPNPNPNPTPTPNPNPEQVGGAVRQLLTTGLWSAKAGKLVAVLQLRDREWQPGWDTERCAPFPPHERDRRRAHSVVSPFAQTHIQKRTCPAPPPAPDRNGCLTPPHPALPRLSSSARPPDKEYGKFSGFTTMDARWMDTLKEAP